MINILTTLAIALLTNFVANASVIIDKEEYEIAFKSPAGFPNFIGVVNKSHDHPEHIPAGTVIPNDWALWKPAAEKGKGEWVRIVAKSTDPAIAKVEPHKLELLEEYCHIIEKVMNDAKEALETIKATTNEINATMQSNRLQAQKMQREMEQALFQRLQQFNQAPVTYYTNACYYPGANTMYNGPMPAQQMHPRHNPQGGRW